MLIKPDGGAQLQAGTPQNPTFLTWSPLASPWINAFQSVECFGSISRVLKLLFLIILSSLKTIVQLSFCHIGSVPLKLFLIRFFLSYSAGHEGPLILFMQRVSGRDAVFLAVFRDTPIKITSTHSFLNYYDRSFPSYHSQFCIWLLDWSYRRRHNHNPCCWLKNGSLLQKHQSHTS